MPLETESKTLHLVRERVGFKDGKNSDIYTGVTTKSLVVDYLNYVLASDSSATIGLTLSGTLPLENIDSIKL